MRWQPTTWASSTSASSRGVSDLLSLRYSVVQTRSRPSVQGSLLIRACLSASWGPSWRLRDPRKWGGYFKVCTPCGAMRGGENRPFHGAETRLDGRLHSPGMNLADQEL